MAPPPHASPPTPAPPPTPTPALKHEVLPDRPLYTDRDSKARHIAIAYANVLTGRVLDVGCDAARLRDHLAPGVEYTGVDLSPEADITVDLDRRPLPFPERSFDTVVCTDVLEHLDRCHDVFDELCRVADRHVLISLPNPLRNLVHSIFGGEKGRLKHYGLPADPPADRHRWFFGAEDAKAFVAERAHRSGFTISHLRFEAPADLYWMGPGGEDVLASDNVRLGTMWALLERTP